MAPCLCSATCKSLKLHETQVAFVNWKKFHPLHRVGRWSLRKAILLSAEASMQNYAASVEDSAGKKF